MRITPLTHAHYSYLYTCTEVCLSRTLLLSQTHTIVIFTHAQRSASHAHYSSHARTLYIAIFAHAQRSASHAHYSFHAHYSYLCTCTEVCLPRTLLLARTHTSYLCTQRSASHTRLLPAMCFRFTIRLKMEKGTF